MTALTQRVEVDAYYTDGRDLWHVTEVHPLGTVTVVNDSQPRTYGIDAFRREFWLVRGPEHVTPEEERP